MEEKNIRELAVQQHKKGYNCAQSVFSACVLSCDSCSAIDEKTALSVSSGFGGGVSCGEICGAVTGGAMAISVAFPYVESEKKEDKKRVKDITAEFTAAFKAKHKRLRCKQLKRRHCDCNELIASAAELAQEMINTKKAQETEE